MSFSRLSGTQAIPAVGQTPVIARSPLALLTVLLLGVGCGEGDAPLVASEGSVFQEDSSEVAPESEVPESEVPEGLDTPELAPYPRGPYGVVEGAIIENLEFYGLRNPLAEGYDMSQGETISLSDYYSPDAEQPELLMISAVAIWCGACRSEYQDFQRRAISTNYAGRGLQMLGVVFEDNERLPADYADLVNWSSGFEVDFPMVLDPGFKTGVYFDRSATPMNMLVDLRTMEILESHTGYNARIFQDEVDPILEASGR